MILEQLYRAFTESAGVTTDSRKIEAGLMFFALHGASFDGNDYAVAALEQGASVAVIDRKDILENNLIEILQFVLGEFRISNQPNYNFGGFQCLVNLV